jgi:sugar phosphate isomerase/epimerase
MNALKLGVNLESLGLPLRRALAAAQQLGVTGVQLDAAGDLAPQRLTQTGRREFRNLLRAHNLELTALNCPLRRGLDIAENQEGRIDHVKNVMSLAFDLGPRIAIVQAGRVPDADAKDDPRGRLLTEALQTLGAHGDRTGTTLALETGLESGAALRDFLARFDTGGLGVNYDPANLLLGGFEPFDSARQLRGRIVHAHARDASRSRASRAAQEVPLGHGDLDWLALVSVFEEIEYRGWLVVEREGGTQRAQDVSAGVAFLRRVL